MKAIERFFVYLKHKGLKPTRFEKDYGFSNGYLGTQFKRKGSLGEEVLITIIDNCLDLSIVWLLTGKGEMLLNSVDSDNPANRDLIESLKFSLKKQEQIIEAQAETILTQRQYIAKLDTSIDLMNIGKGGSSFITSVGDFDPEKKAQQKE